MALTSPVPSQSSLTYENLTPDHVMEVIRGICGLAPDFSCLEGRIRAELTYPFGDLTVERIPNSLAVRVALQNPRGGVYMSVWHALKYDMLSIPCLDEEVRRIMADAPSAAALAEMLKSQLGYPYRYLRIDEKRGRFTVTLRRYQGGPVTF